MQIRQQLRRHLYYRHIRFLSKKIFDEELTYYAAGLSFYTISTIIPLFFIIFSLIPKLERFNEDYAMLKSFMIGHLLPVQTDVITKYIDDFINNATQLGIFSLTFTIIISLLFFLNFSYVVNTVFKTKDRGMFKTVFTYFLLVVFVPIGLTFSFYLTGRIDHLLGTYALNNNLEMTRILPFFIEWTLFFLIYKFAPNVYVYYKAALISAFSSVIIWSITKSMFVNYVFFAKATSTIYGPFSITIFALTWIYLSWIIFVYGLRLCYLINRSYGYSQSHQKKPIKQ